MGVTSGKPTKVRVSSPPALCSCPLSPTWLSPSWLQPENNAQNPKPLPSGPGPPHPPCPHLAPKSPGSLEVLCPCVFAHVIPLLRRPFLLFVPLRNFPWVPPGRLTTLCARGYRCGQHHPGLRHLQLHSCTHLRLALSFLLVNSLPEGSSVRTLAGFSVSRQPCSVSELHKGTQQGSLV